MNAAIERQADGRYLLSGELTLASVPALWKEGAGMLEQASGELCFDLQGVQRTDSAGLALLVDWLRRGRERGLHVQFHNLPAQLRAIAAVSGLAELLPVVDASARRDQTA